ncbi:unnamed protein product [Timema podura]|uniref:SSD domain-containing protein n=1 Tax=Timema podura TaxID=61482 RepID=A0ABN7PJM3_TIMPD|nr:unnamed protein product [Timema podura]
MASRIFQAHGEFCASYPWEVIVATLTLTVCMLTVDQRPIGLPPEPQRQCNWGNNCLGLEEYNAVDVIVMTIIRCVAVLYSYYQFCQLHKLGSKYILGKWNTQTGGSHNWFHKSSISGGNTDIETDSYLRRHCSFANVDSWDHPR